jgi:hypothetical protein
MFNLVKAKVDLTEKVVLEVKSQAGELNKELSELHNSIRVDSVSTCHLFKGVRYFLWIQGIGYPNDISCEDYKDGETPNLKSYVEVQLNNLIINNV